MTSHAALPRHRPDRRRDDLPALGRLRRRRARRAGPGLIALRARLGLVALLLLPGLAPADELGINLYGLSYHHELGTDNEVNPGLGVRWRMPREAFDGAFDFFLEAGAYRDSGRNTAVLAGG